MIAFAAAVVGWSPPAHAAVVFTVIDPTDAPDANLLDGQCASTFQGLCTLRAAIQQAEQAGGGEVILSAGFGAYTLTIPAGSEHADGAMPNPAVGDLDISTSITVTGAGADVSVIDGGGAVRVFDVHLGGVLRVNGVTIQNGKADYDGLARHSHGGAIHNHGTLVLTNSVLSDSSATVAGWGGGGLTNAGTGNATLRNVTIARNTTDAMGGGIENLGTLSMLNVTIAQNTAPAGQGGGIFTGVSGVKPATTRPTNTLIALNTNGGGCKTTGSVQSGGYNLDQDGTCALQQSTDLTGDPGFQAGLVGSPIYYALMPTSRATDAGSPIVGFCPSPDVIGQLRPQDGNGDGIELCDIGSYELPPPPPPSFSIANVRIREGNSGTKLAHFVVTMTPASAQAVTVQASTANQTATAPSDYKAKSATIVLEPGSTSKPFDVSIVGDLRREPNETFRVGLFDQSNTLITAATGTIMNND
jgi:hypothetical protein